VVSSSSNYIACKKCNKLKPYSDFILGKNAKLQVRYSPFCKSCRILMEKEAQKKKDSTINPKDD
jgi:Pyruvate/2-oxoacid:ferredoxin oxidoreductase delta subunit